MCPHTHTQNTQAPLTQSIYLSPITHTHTHSHMPAGKGFTPVSNNNSAFPVCSCDNELLTLHNQPRQVRKHNPLILTHSAHGTHSDIGSVNGF